MDAGIKASDESTQCQYCMQIFRGSYVPRHKCTVSPGDREDRDVLLVEREKTHGDFRVNAMISQQLKGVFIVAGYKDLDLAQREALDMIALKLSRILSGQANFKDHWDDIAGYAKLAAEACTK